MHADNSMLSLAQYHASSLLGVICAKSTLKPQAPISATRWRRDRVAHRHVCKSEVGATTHCFGRSCTRRFTRPVDYTSLACTTVVISDAIRRTGDSPSASIEPMGRSCRFWLAYGQAGSVLSWYHSRPEENEQERSSGRGRTSHTH